MGARGSKRIIPGRTPSASPRAAEHWHTACTPQKHMCFSLAGEANSQSLLARTTADIDGRTSHPSPTVFAQADVSRPCFRHAPWPDGSPPPFSACARAGVDPKPTGRSFFGRGGDRGRGARHGRAPQSPPPPTRSSSSSPRVSSSPLTCREADQAAPFFFFLAALVGAALAAAELLGRRRRAPRPPPRSSPPPRSRSSPPRSFGCAIISTRGATRLSSRSGRASSSRTRRRRVAVPRP